MPFCSGCGTRVKDEDRFCPKCGHPQARAGAEAASPTAATAPAAAAAAGLTDNAAACLAYVCGFVTGIIFLVVQPYAGRPHVRFHACQSIVFNVAWVALYVAMTLLFMIVAILGVPYAGFLLHGLLQAVFWLGGMALWIVLMVTASQGKRLRVPVIGGIAARFAAPPQP